MSTRDHGLSCQCVPFTSGDARCLFCREKDQVKELDELIRQQREKYSSDHDWAGMAVAGGAAVTYCRRCGQYQHQKPDNVCNPRLQEAMWPPVPDPPDYKEDVEKFIDDLWARLPGTWHAEAFKDTVRRLMKQHNLIF
jgi:hypothetical protein